MQIIKNFTQLNKNDINIAGGKGASLGEMLNAGIQVPAGFVILAEVFDEFIRQAKLTNEIDNILVKVKTQKTETVNTASEKIRDLIIKAEVPFEISQSIKKEFKKLNVEFVAIRSSATAEDGMDAAWAGQLESYLDTTEENLIKNIKKCWSSLFTPRAIFYRIEKNLSNQKISVAVIVQAMIESEVSGIAFSVHPVTGDHNQLIIEGGYGLGEAIVSGAITPDSYIVNKTKLSADFIEKDISRQEKQIVRSNNGGVQWTEVPTSKQERQKLNNEQIIELSRLIIQIEKLYVFPCDVEWALQNDKFYILQSRPITTLK